MSRGHPAPENTSGDNRLVLFMLLVLTIYMLMQTRTAKSSYISVICTINRGGEVDWIGPLDPPLY